MEQMRVALGVWGLSLVLAAAGCSRAQASDGHDDADGGAVDEEGHAPAAHAKAHAPAAKAVERGRRAPAKGASHAPPPTEHEPEAPSAPSSHGGGGGDEKRAKFIIPFTWDSSDEEPLARMRAFMRSALGDNTKYAAEHKAEFFRSFANGQKPRATLVTCSDSRVQSTAFDATPENDVFTIRNIGNQMLTSEGSVEYGVHHLKTPLLLIMGHSGCGAVKAAMGDYTKESSPIVRELSTLKIPRTKEGSAEEQLTQGVVANVHSQVSLAVLKFGEEVERGDLTVVGAVYDFRDDMRRGAGRFTIVNVNGNAEPERVEAFTRAMLPSSPPMSRPTKDQKPRADH